MSNEQFDIEDTWAVLDEIRDASTDVDARAVQAAAGRAALGGVSREQIMDAIYHGRSKTPGYREMLDVDELQRETTTRSVSVRDRADNEVGTAVITVKAESPFRPHISPALSDVIDWVSLRETDDVSVLAKDLICDLCGAVIYQHDDGDSLGCLARRALDHMHTCSGWDAHSKWPRPSDDNVIV